MEQNTYKTGAELIATERYEQIAKHGFDIGDDDYVKGELLEAAIQCLGLVESKFFHPNIQNGMFWPWKDNREAFLKIYRKDSIGRLKVAGAFIAAEIDRLQRIMQEPKDAQEPLPVVLPTTLDEAVDYMLPRFAGMEKYMNKGEDDFAAFCHSQLSGGIGMKIRNEFKLWIHESPLHQYFLTEHNLFHADDMSDLIIRKIYHKLQPAA